MAEQRSAVLQAVQDWVSEFVVGHNLCPLPVKNCERGELDLLKRLPQTSNRFCIA